MVPYTSAPTHTCTGLPACWTDERFPAKIAPGERAITRRCGSRPSMTILSTLPELTVTPRPRDLTPALFSERSSLFWETPLPPEGGLEVQPAESYVESEGRRPARVGGFTSSRCFKLRSQIGPGKGDPGTPPSRHTHRGCGEGLHRDPKLSPQFLFPVVAVRLNRRDNMAADWCTSITRLRHLGILASL